MSIDVYATAGAIEKDLRNHACVIVDVLRASSVITTAIEHGCKSVIPVAEVEDAAMMARQLGGERVLLCGERQGLLIPGFNLSNSPLEYTQEAVSGRVLVMSTTNGTRAILRTGSCKAMFMGSFLNAKAVAERLDRIGPPAAEGFFEYDAAEDGVHIGNIRWTEEAGGPIKVYRPPVKGRPYVVGGDTAGDGSDWFVGQVLDNVTGEQVAVLRHEYDEDTYARQLYCLGRWYNEAMLAPETNFSTYPVKLLDLMGYQNLYVREIEDTYDGTIRHAFGFRTDRLTRPVIVSELIRVLRDHLDTVNDKDTLLEMLTFVRNEKQRPEAEPGAHDDCVISLAIAHYVRPQQTMQVRTTDSRGTKNIWSDDMWEDFNKASQADREIMIRMWGEPSR